MANVVINSTSEVRLYESKIIAQVEDNSFMMPMVGDMNDMNAFVYRPSEMYKKGKIWTVPLTKAVTTAALEDGATYEGQGQKAIVSTSDIEVNERGQVFGGFDTFEEVKTILDLREVHYQEAAQWHTQDFDLKAFNHMKLALASMPTRANRSASQYNVEYAGDAISWDGLNATHFVSSKGIAKMKKYFQVYRGIRPGRLGNGKFGYILILPAEATYQLGQEDVDYKTALQYALPRSEDHIFFKGHGLNPWGAWDGVVIVEDQRPVYGGTDYTFLNTELETSAGFMRFQGIFMGAQAMAYAAWKDITWFERVWDHGRKFEVSVNRMLGWIRPAVNLNTLGSPSLRDYGLGYYGATAPLLT